MWTKHEVQGFCSPSICTLLLQGFKLVTRQVGPNFACLNLWITPNWTAHKNSVQAIWPGILLLLNLKSWCYTNSWKCACKCIDLRQFYLSFRNAGPNSWLFYWFFCLFSLAILKAFVELESFHTLSCWTIFAWPPGCCFSDKDLQFSSTIWCVCTWGEWTDCVVKCVW